MYYNIFKKSLTSVTVREPLRIKEEYYYSKGPGEEQAMVTNTTFSYCNKQIFD